ncbi:MAG: sensor domain-containing diguanylate cyclase [Tenericutes bacterium]|nr:sensor domain-containing diguanylate cyclase [Mycoplasmatota bacterium]
MFKFDKDLFMTNLYEGIYVVDKNRKILFWNSGSEKITGYKAEEVINSFCYDNILQHVDSTGKQLCFSGCPLQGTLETGEINEAEVFLHHKDGHRVPVSVKSIPMYDDNNNLIAVVEAFTDASHRAVKHEEIVKLKKILDIDSLTSIYNRRYLDFYLNNAVLQNKEFNSPFGLLFFDIDHFKKVNDTYGHIIGDKILKIIAKTLKLALRPTDVLGRWGGEEFIAVIKDVSVDILADVAERLRIICKNSFLTLDNGEDLSVTISIGGSLYIPEEPIESLIARADEYMYKAKENGRDRVVIK